MRWHKQRGQRRDDLITASEIASYAYCPEAWRLEHGLGLSADNRASLDAGTQHHAGKAAVERLAGWSILVGRVLVLAAVLALLLWVLYR